VPGYIFALRNPGNCFCNPPPRKTRDQGIEPSLKSVQSEIFV